jgi:2-(1,2-epoxy-1,2-dihydrophenyl)acetyl-CoA isomerase
MDKPSYEKIVADARAVTTKLVEIERRDEAAIVRLNDPTALNALSFALTLQLRDALERLVADPETRAVIITGANGAFSAGGDLRAMVGSAHPLVDEGDEGAIAVWRWIRQQFGGIVRTIVSADKPFIAAIPGAAAGVGLAFAMACDLVVASTEARLVTAFAKVGLVPEVGLSWLLTRRLGHHKTFELYIRQAPIDAAEAQRLGLVNEVVPAGQEVERACAWARQALTLSAPALALTKPLLRAAANMTFHDALVMEEFAEPMCFTSQAHREGVRALLQRR